MEGNFSVDFNNPQTGIMEVQIVNALLLNGADTATPAIPPGTYTLGVVSECRWRVGVYGNGTPAAQ